MIDADCRLVRDWGIKNARPLLKGRVLGPRYHPSFPGRRRRRDSLTTYNGVYRRALRPAAPGVGGGRKSGGPLPGEFGAPLPPGLHQPPALWRQGGRYYSRSLRISRWGILAGA